MEPSAASTRSRVAWKCPARIAPSFTRGLDKNRYAALVFVQSWQARGIDCPSLLASCQTSLRNRRPSLRSQNREQTSSFSSFSADSLLWELSLPLACRNTSAHCCFGTLLAFYTLKASSTDPVAPNITRLVGN